MMFKSRFHAGIRDGSITTTFRYWKRPQARIGALQKIKPIGHIEITGIRVVKPTAIRKPQAIAAGFATARELIDYIGTYDSDERELYRIDFKWVGQRIDLEPDRRAIVANEEIEAIDKALDVRDRNSGVGPWTRKTLNAIRTQPGVSSEILAKQLKRNRFDLKRDVRKLKSLGLTISLEVGYKLSAKGESYLAARETNSGPASKSSHR